LREIGAEKEPEEGEISEEKRRKVTIKKFFAMSLMEKNEVVGVWKFLSFGDAIQCYTFPFSSIGP
jgi:hypothetical protein